jgi:DNA-binding transcriptional LysR family regulator
LIQMAEAPETAELLAFASAVESASLSAAARRLGVPRATIGRRLARLEEKLGARLLRRTTRALALTDAGEAFYRHARIALDAVAQAESSVQRRDDRIRGTLRVAVPPILDPAFHAMVAEFARAYPDVLLLVNASTRHVDLRREGYDLALRAGSMSEPGLVARTLVRDALIAVASPAYLQARGTPRSARALRQHRCLTLFERGEVPRTHWPRRGGGKVPIESHFVANDLLLLEKAALTGLGIALLPMLMVTPRLERGELVHVLPDLIREEARVALVYPEKEFLPPQVRAFIDAVVAWAPGRLTGRRSALREPGPPPR